jgi:flagellar hook-associated protein 1 FlgK
MSGLFSTLDASVSAMNAQSIAINVTGKNLANVNNSNYARETVNFGSLGTVETSTGPESMGITALGVQSLRNALLDTQVRNSDSQVSYYTTQQSGYQQAQAALGQTVSSSDSTSSTSGLSDGGLGSALDGLFSAFQSYAANPTGTGEQQGVLQSASILTDQLQTTDANLAQVQSGLNSQVSSTVTSTNSLLSDVASLNTQINQLEANNPGSAVDLRDQRETDLEQIATNLPITVTEGSNGEDLVTADGATGSAVTLVSQGSVTGPLTFDGTSTISGGSPSGALSLSSGAIQGAIAASTGGIQTLRDSLNSLASQLVTSVNAVYNPSGSGSNFFDPSGTTAGTIALASGLTASTLKAGTGAAGDNTIALGIANLANTSFSTAGGDDIDGTFDSYYAGTVSGFGQTLAGVNDQATDETNIQTLVTSQRASVSGVNLDEEMSNLLMYQRSYQASAQVFQTVDSLLDNFITTLGTITS